MTSLLSQKNSSTAPVLANAIFEGSYEQVTNFSTAVITVYADTESQLTVYQSQLGTTPASFAQYQIPANSRQTFNIQIAYPYLYLTLDNLDGAQDQTFLNLCTIYRSVGITDISGGASTGSNVNINSITPGVVLPVSLDGVVDISGNVDIGNWPKNLAVNDSQLAFYTTYQMWNDDITAGTVTNALNLNAGYVNNLSLYGTLFTDVSCRLQVVFSPDTGTWFGTQYIYQMDNSGDFGFNLPGTAASYVAVKLLDNDNALTLWGELRA